MEISHISLGKVILWVKWQQNFVYKGLVELSIQLQAKKSIYTKLLDKTYGNMRISTVNCSPKIFSKCNVACTLDFSNFGYW